MNEFDPVFLFDGFYNKCITMVESNKLILVERETEEKN